MFRTALPNTALSPVFSETYTQDRALRGEMMAFEFQNGKVLRIYTLFAFSQNFALKFTG